MNYSHSCPDYYYSGSLQGFDFLSLKNRLEINLHAEFKNWIDIG